jgi:drug/metabolite transporter (DMT)-like permease
MPFYVYAWIASILYGLYAITAKLVGKYKLGNVAQFSFFITLFSGIVTATISIANGAGIPSRWLYVVLAALFLSIGNILYLSALKNLDVSVMSPLFNLRVVISVFFGYLFLGENLNTKSIILIGLIVVAGIFATMDEKFSVKTFFTGKIALGLFFMFVLSIQNVFVNRAIADTNYWTASLWMSLLAIIFSFVFLFGKFYKDVLKSKPIDYVGVLILSVFGGLGDLAAYKAFGGNVGVSSVIISLPMSMFLVFIFAMWKPSLLEKHTLKVYIVRLVSAGFMIWGALMLSG